MINATWDLLEVAFIILVWVETSNKTLEEIDELIDGEMHSDAPILRAVIAGDVEVSPDGVLDSLTTTTSHGSPKPKEALATVKPAE